MLQPVDILVFEGRYDQVFGHGPMRNGIEGQEIEREALGEERGGVNEKGYGEEKVKQVAARHARLI